MQNLTKGTDNLSLEEKRALLARVLREKSRLSKAFPLSFAQERLWFLNQLEPDSPFYNVANAVRLSGPLDLPALERTVAEVMRRHEALRTSFPLQDGRPVQRISPSAPVRLPVTDLSGLEPAEREREAAREASEEARRPFDLTAGPLLRARVLRLGEEEHVVMLTMHHIVSDGWSMGILVREVSALYDAYSKGEESPLAELPIQYPDYAVWQRDWLQGEALETELQYWKRQLSGAPPLLELPTDRTRPPVQTYRGAVHSITLSAEMTEGLKELSRREGTTLFMTMLAAFKVLLSRYSGQTDISVGTDVANRNRSEVEGLIGFFINQLVLRTDLSDGPTFRQHLRRVREVCLGAYQHQELPFEKLVEELNPARSLSHSPLFQVSFSLNTIARESLRSSDLKLGSISFKDEAAKFDISLSVVEGGGRLGCVFEYNTDLFDGPTIERMAGHFANLLEAILRDPSRAVTELPIMGEDETRRLLVEFNDTAADYPRELCLHQLFEAQAARTPDAEAVVFGQHRLTYAELERRANRLAHHLRTLGVGPESLVGILLERSAEMVVSVLAVLKAGGAYVPLDPQYPQERLRFMIEDACARVLITQQSLADTFGGSAAVVVLVDTDAALVASNPSTAPASSVVPENLAYAIYTSGSTGRPKGSLVSHSALVNYTLLMRSRLGLNPADRFLQFASFSFDVFVEEVFPALCAGAGVVMGAAEEMMTSEGLGRLIEREGVTLCELPAAFWHEWVRSLAEAGESVPASLRSVLVGCEKPSPERVGQWLGMGLPLVQVYGLTETAITSTVFEVTPGAGDADGSAWAWRPGREVPLGRAVENTRLYVLDAGMRPAPVGVAGELYIGGEGLGRGYLNRPSLTAERFVPDPFGSTPGERLYKTGDLVRYLPDGNIEFIGRADEQVKVRGFRVELGEIEAALQTHAGVRECVAIVRASEGGDKRLIAYVVAEGGAEGIGAAELRAHLKGRLPEYMVPAAFVLLDELPLTPNGKVDKRALPEPSRNEAGSDYVGARTPVEEVLAGVWSRLLGVETVGVHDNFFELGGHSLLATQLVSRVREAFGVEVPLRTVFESPTVAELAESVEAAMRAEGGSELSPIVRVSREQPLPLSFAQERLWFLDQLEPDSPFYNVANAVRLSGALDLPALERTVAEVVRRHEVLRTSFPLEGDRPVQRISPAVPVRLPVTDLSGLPAPERELEAAKESAAEARQPFDLTTGPLLRARVLRLGEEEHVVMLTMHHIVSDGWSMGLLIKEVSALYTAYSKGEESPLEELPVQYADYAVWQRDRLQGEALEGQLAYWRGHLSGAPPLLELPTDRPRPAVQTFRGAAYSFALPAELTGALKELSRREGVTLFMTMLAAFKVLLSRYSGQADISVGTDVAGRGRAETEGLIGFFVNQLVLRTDLSDGPTFRQLLRRVREVCLGAYAHQDLPFERLVEELNPARSLSHSPLFQVSFNMDYGRGEALELGGLNAGGVGSEGRWSKFDLTLGVAESGGVARAAFEYNTDLFDRSTVERMAGHLLTLLKAAAGDAEAAVGELPLMGEEETNRLIVGFNETAAEYPRERCAHGLFEEQAVRTPEAVAVTFGEVALSYRQLDERANRLARHLQSLGVGPESLVGVLLERSEQMIVSILGVLKAGGAYVPLDPAYPQERLRFMLEDSDVAVLITQESLAALLGEAAGGVRLVRVDADSALIASNPSTAPASSVVPENLAYAIYTSGSTGRPKGSLISHSALVNYTLAMRSYFELSPADRFLQFASFSFDVFVEEVFPALSAGAGVVMGAVEEMMTAAGLMGLVEREGVTLCELPTAYWHEWLNELDEKGESVPESLRLVIIGGENALRERVQHWKQFRVPLMNAYGLTEVTVTSVVYTMPAGGGDEGWWEFPIGRPIMNTQAYVLDARLRPVPVGVQGELYIGGDSLGRGYLKRPGLTAEKFVPNPFSPEPGARLYKTGDRVRYLPDGKIENLGRIDFQVKVRGFRVELGEIEAVLSQHAAVGECTVQARGHAGDKRLVAYVVCAGQDAPSVSELRAYLKERLPDYMTPSLFVFIDKVPLTPNGKVDRRALPEPEQVRPDLEAEFVAPRTQVEEALAGIWVQLLGVDQVGVHDNFFELGGHSLLATQLVSRVREAFGVEVPLRTVFESPTVAQLAASVGDSFEAKEEEAGELSDILDALENLSEDEARRLLEEKLGPGASEGDALTAASN